MQVEPEVNGVVGDDATLRCTFRSTSPVTGRLSVDWTYRPVDGEASHSFFYYHSKAFPQTEGLFKDRVSWQGDVNRGDASLQLRNLTLNDNGTFTCTVRNPPDVHGNVAKTVLTVTPRGNPIRITEFFLLAGLVLLPSALVVLVLLVRMGCNNGILGRRKTHVLKRSPIEASDGFPKNALAISPCSVNWAQLSVHTQPEVNVMEGSPALLPCTFTLGPGDRLQSVNVDWENPNSTVIFYHYHHNYSVSTQKSVVFVGNISQNNASILLRDVRLMDEGNYLCLVRVGMNRIKNGTELRVRGAHSSSL
ncbi:UNVERIFIED_CONTAM: hypothetical protein FKN15_002719 [Acipenser sinensis]